MLATWRELTTPLTVFDIVAAMAAPPPHAMSAPT
jgi:hypothetical protein